MGLLHKFSKIKHITRELIYPKPVRLKLDSAIFTFTFDDVPVSAVTHGAQILEKFGARGTYYVSLGMSTPCSNRSSRCDDFKHEGRIYFADTEEVVDLVKRGHDVGCHSYSHKAQSRQRLDAILNDCERNSDALSEITGETVKHYSFPFGDVSLRAKRELRCRYQTLRSTAGGVNSGRIDLSYLKAVKIYSWELDRIKLIKLIESAILGKAWVIFYTHEVCNSPNQWGTTVTDFEWIVREIYNRNARIMSMSQVSEGVIGLSA